MIPVEKVFAAHLALLKAEWPHVGDGAPPPGMPAEDSRPWSWASPAGRPGMPPTMGGGEPTGIVRIRVSSTAVDGDGPGARAARSQAQSLADLQRAVMLSGPMLSGDGWRVTGRWLESTADEPQPGAHTVHQDYRLHVSTTAA